MEHGPFEDVFLIEHRDILYAGKAIHKAISTVPITIIITKIPGIPENERDSYLIGVPRFESPKLQFAISWKKLNWLVGSTHLKIMSRNGFIFPKK